MLLELSDVMVSPIANIIHKAQWSWGNLGLSKIHQQSSSTMYGKTYWIFVAIIFSENSHIYLIIVSMMSDKDWFNLSHYSSTLSLIITLADWSRLEIESLKSWVWFPLSGLVLCAGMWSVGWKTSWSQGLVDTISRSRIGPACADEQCLLVSWCMFGGS
jgi:hypothetical protein